MSKEAVTTAAPGKEKIQSVRIRTGGVHYTGARIVTTLTLDKSAVNIAGANIVTCEEIAFHPAGIMFRGTDGINGVIPYANVEIVYL
jgi:hypothetical protein